MFQPPSLVPVLSQSFPSSGSQRSVAFPSALCSETPICLSTNGPTNYSESISRGRISDRLTAESSCDPSNNGETRASTDPRVFEAAAAAAAVDARSDPAAAAATAVDGRDKVGRRQRRQSELVECELNQQTDRSFYMTLRQKTSRKLQVEDRSLVARPVMQEKSRPLKKWLIRHRDAPYPTGYDKRLLAQQCSMTITQVSNWFANARRRLKRTVRDPRLSWAGRIKLYDKCVVGKQEPLDVTSVDSDDDDDNDDVVDDSDVTSHLRNRFCPISGSDVTRSSSSSSSPTQSDVIQLTTPARCLLPTRNPSSLSDGTYDDDDSNDVDLRVTDNYNNNNNNTDSHQSNLLVRSISFSVSNRRIQDQLCDPRRTKFLLNVDASDSQLASCCQKQQISGYASAVAAEQLDSTRSGVQEHVHHSTPSLPRSHSAVDDSHSNTSIEINQHETSFTNNCYSNKAVVSTDDCEKSLDAKFNASDVRGYRQEMTSYRAALCTGRVPTIGELLFAGKPGSDDTPQPENLCVRHRRGMDEVEATTSAGGCCRLLEQAVIWKNWTAVPQRKQQQQQAGENYETLLNCWERESNSSNSSSNSVSGDLCWADIGAALALTTMATSGSTRLRT